MAEVDMPAPKADEVLVHVMAVSVNPADWHSMRGKPPFSRATLGLLRPKHQLLGVDIAGRVEAVERDRYYTRAALDRFVAVLRGSDGARGIVPSELRQRLGISRKYLIPLLEWADSRGVTEWEGDVRRVREPRPA